MMQPATKALAQVLVGNTRASGQFVHARNILEQADQMVQDRAVDRMPPRLREDFLEQLARLKLTISDAAEFEDEREVNAEESNAEVPAKKEVAPERLRELALRLAGGSSAVEKDDVHAIGSPEPLVKARREPDESALISTEEDDNANTDDAQTKRQTRSPKSTGVRASKLRLNVPRDDVSPADAS